MKLGINLTGLYPGKIGGAEQYARNIISKFETYKDLQLYIFLNESGYKTFKLKRNIHLVKIEINENPSKQLKAYIDYYGLDVWFCPLLFLEPIDCQIPNITTIFDIQQYFYPEYFEKDVLEMRIDFTKQTVEKTNTILTVSEFSKKTILDMHKIDGKKIVITNLDSDESFYQPLEKKKASKIKMRLPKNYILFPANMWPHKNHISLLKAFKIVKEKYCLDIKLVFTGAKEKETESIKKFINNNNLMDDVFYLGYIDQDDMRYVFSFAKMLVFPSLYEGFPLPIVEAMRSDIPIVCSNTTCLPEMTGNAAVLINPNKPKEISRVIYNVYKDSRLRNMLIENGRKKRTEYSWDKCAYKTYEEIKKLYVKKNEVPAILNEQPLVSIIIPVNNIKSNIIGTVDSVLKQTYKNYEVIVIGKIFKYCNNNEKVRYIFDDSNCSKASLLNKAILNASGEIIGVFEHDDYLDKNALIKVCSCFKNHDIDLVYTNASEEKLDITVFDFNEFISGCYINRPTYFFTNKCFKKYGQFNERYLIYESYDFWLRVGKKGKLLYIPEKLTKLKGINPCNENDIEEILHILRRNHIKNPINWVYKYSNSIDTSDEAIKFLKISKYGFKRNVLNDLFKLTKVGAKKKKDNNIWYSDGWISREYSKELFLNGNENKILIRGENHCQFSDLKIKIVINKDRKEVFIGDKVNFEIMFPIKKHYGEKIVITLKPNKYIVPHDVNGTNDFRKLSIILKKIEAI